MRSKSGIGVLCAMMVLLCVVFARGQNTAGESKGEGLFKRYCQSCHPAGKNVINPAKTLYPQDLKKNGIETPEAIVKLMRKAPPGMTSFDESVLPDKDADAIARYILQTFK